MNRGPIFHAGGAGERARVGGGALPGTFFKIFRKKDFSIFNLMQHCCMATAVAGRAELVAFARRS